MCDRFPQKFDVHNFCCEHEISLGNLSHDSAFDRRTLLSNKHAVLKKPSQETILQGVYETVQREDLKDININFYSKQANKYVYISQYCAHVNKAWV